MKLLPVRLTIAALFLLTPLLRTAPVEAQQIYVNEFYRAGNLGTTDEWIEVVLAVPLTAAQLEGFYIGDSTAATAAKFSGYRFTNMSSLAASFPAGTILVIAGATGPAADSTYNPGGGDWNLTLKTSGTNLTGNGSTGDLAGTDVVYVDTNGTNGNATLSANGFAVNWDITPGVFGALANVLITVPGNNTGAVLSTGLDVATTAANWTTSVALGSMTPGQPNGGSNTTYINTLRGSGPALPVLTVNDVALFEGDAGTTTFAFTVTLSAPAGVGGVTFDITTADNTATLADNDYVLNSLVGQTIAVGASTFPFNVTVNGDPTIEPNETFFVNVTNVTGATVGDAQGTGTINNDDVVLTPIHTIQGNGASSPLVSTSVSTRGVVTGVKGNGFFIQEPDASVDADPATSEGVFVFTNVAPPVAAAVGNLVQVTGTVSEFVPTQDPMQPPVTELVTPAVSLVSSGNPMPAAIPLTATFPDPAGVHDQLERIEGMRASVASLTVVAPTQGFINEANAAATSNGVFYGVVTGVARPFREAGIPAPDPAPSGGGTIPPIPRFDSNPERIRVDSDALSIANLLDVGTGTVVTGLVGPLDYTFRTYTILPEAGSIPVASGGPTPAAVTIPTAQELTVASFNLQRFFDTVNDPTIGEPVLTGAAFANRLNKASLAIRDYLRTPDILGVIEVENLTTLQSLAAKISADAIAASQPDPQYAAFLVEGNDVGGIDVGFLVKTAPVVAATPRVAVTEVLQELDGTLFVNPDASTETLNDRPTLRLTGVVNHANGASFPLTVLVNHLRSLNDVNSEAVGSNGWATLGARVRAKRQAQAVDLANLIQARQTAAPTERIVVIGDFNAFEVNDGLVDSMGVIDGSPSPDNETAVPGDGVDLVNPDLVNLFTTPPAAERYSYSFDGNAQSIDHILINGPMGTATVAYREEHPRIDADFAEVARNNSAAPTRLSDHDPVVAYFQVAGFAVADLAITKTDTPDPVAAGTNLTYTITATNLGPDAAATASWSDTLPAGTTFVALPAVAGWSCTTPAVGSGGTVSCSNAAFAVGAAAFTLTVAVDPSLAAATVLSNTVTVTSTTADPVPGNNSATTTTTVFAPSAVTATKTVSGDFSPGGTVTYTLVLANAGPGALQDLPGDELTDVLPLSLQLVSASAGSGTATAVVATNTVTWNGTIAAGGSVTVTVTAQVLGNVGTSVSNQATIAWDGDGDGISNEATGVSDDPAAGGGADPTVFLIEPRQSVLEIPTLDGLGLALLALLLAAAGAVALRRRPA